MASDVVLFRQIQEVNQILRRMIIMKTVKSIKTLFGEELNINAMEILATGENWVMAKYKGYGFTKTYGPWNGYTVEFAD